jgi:hypothetical protein
VVEQALNQFLTISDAEGYCSEEFFERASGLLKARRLSTEALARVVDKPRAGATALKFFRAARATG